MTPYWTKYWLKVVAKNKGAGPQGIQGIQGDPGPQGDPGTSSYSNSVIIDMGSVPTGRKYFETFDSNIHANSKIIAQVNVDTATKDADENEMDALHVNIATIDEGFFGYYVVPQEGYVHDNFVVTYSVS
jgi:hypothetical protein